MPIKWNSFFTLGIQNVWCKENLEKLVFCENEIPAFGLFKKGNYKRLENYVKKLWL